MGDWVEVCSTTDIDEEDLITWEHKGHLYAIYKLKSDFFATDGMCTHEKQSLEEGLVVDCVIECPLHGGRFDICTGKAISAPVYEDLQTYPIKIEENKIFLKLT